MTQEYGAQAVLSDDAWASPDMRAATREQLAVALAAVGVAQVQFDERRQYHPPRHDSAEHHDCPYAVFALGNPGADANEFPECGDDGHWLPGLWANTIDAWGEAVPA